MEQSRAPISIVIPTYRRERVLLETLGHLLATPARASEILVVDQTSHHEPETERQLSELDAVGQIAWIRLDRPSIPGAMNVGLVRAKEGIVLFLDDDLVPDANLVAAHVRAHDEAAVSIVAGQVIQPWEDEAVLDDSSPFGFPSLAREWVREFMGGNFSVKRTMGLCIGGFDENFIDVAYRFEADFADRILGAGGRILFEPTASVRHLKASAGGTRAYGDHLRTAWPSHAIGEYYYLLRRWRSPGVLRRLLGRPIGSIKTRHHLRRPWWIPATLTAELLGFCWGLVLALRGPRYLRQA